MIRSLCVLAAALLATSLPATAQTVTAAPDVAPGAGLAARAMPQRDPSLWFADGDYPIAALRAEQAGRVGLLLEIASDGRVDSCTMLSSSKAEALDRTSCRILVRRARFTPALGKDRKPAADRWNVSIDWKLPQFQPRPPQRDVVVCMCLGGLVDYIGPKPLSAPEDWILPADYPPELAGRTGSMEITLTVDRSGAPRLCRITGSSGSRKWDRLACAILRQRARFQPEREAPHKWGSRRWVQRYSWGADPAAPDTKDEGA